MVLKEHSNGNQNNHIVADTPNYSKPKRNKNTSDNKAKDVVLSEEEILLQWTGATPIPQRERLPDKVVDTKEKSPEWHRRRILKKLIKQKASITGNDTYLALDCEMVGTGSNGEISSVARVSIVNWFGEVVLDTFVKVPVPVTDFRTGVSGIQAKHISSRDAMPFEDCRALVQHLLQGRILIGHGLENDLNALRLTHPWADTRDSASYPPLMREAIIDNSPTPVLRPRKLRDLAWEKLGRNIQKYGYAHSSVEDATASLQIYKVVKGDWDAHIKWQLHSLKLPSPPEYTPNKHPAPTNRNECTLARLQIGSRSTFFRHKVGHSAESSSNTFNNHYATKNTWHQRKNYYQPTPVAWR